MCWFLASKIHKDKGLHYKHLSKNIQDDTFAFLVNHQLFQYNQFKHTEKDHVKFNLGDKLGDKISWTNKTIVKNYQ